MQSLALFLALPLFGAQEKPSADQIHALVKELGSESVEDRDRASEKLRAMGKAALPELRKAAAGSDAELSSRAKRLVNLIPALEKITPNLRNVLPRVEERLGEGDPHVWTELLLEAVHVEDLDGTFRIEEVTIQDLGPIVPLALEHARNENELRLVHSCALAGWALGAPAANVAELLGHSNPRVRYLALRALHDRMITGKASAVVPLLADPDPEVSKYAPMVLSGLGAKAYLPRLLPFLSDDPPDWLLRDLKEQHVREAIPALLMCFDRTSGKARGSVIDVLASLRATEAIPRLGEQLASGDPDTVRVAAVAIRKLKAKEMAPALVRLLGHPDENARDLGVSILGYLGVKSAIPALRASLSDEDPGVRSYAIDALATLERRGDCMKGVILAAGYGSRISKQNGHGSKVLLRVEDNPLIDYALSAFEEAGITEAAVVVGHEA